MAYNIKDVIRSNIIEYLRDNIHTVLIAKVISVSELASKQVIDVKPLIADNYSDEIYNELPNILKVPVLFPSGGGGFLSFPIKKGDDVLLLINERNINQWKFSNSTESLHLPDDRRTNSLVDAIAIPCLYTTKNNLSPDPDHVVLKFAGSEVTLYNTGDVTVSAANDANVTAAANINLNALGDVNITASGAVSISSTTLTHNGTDISSTHVHSGVQSGGSNTGTPV